MIRRWVLAAFTAAALGESFPCECSRDLGHPEGFSPDQYQEAGFVLRAVTTDLSGRKQGRQAALDFRLEKVYKCDSCGLKGDSVRILTPASGAACGQAFTLGADYIILGRVVRTPKGHVYATDMCAGSFIIAEHPALMDSLAAYAKPGKKATRPRP